MVVLSQTFCNVCCSRGPYLVDSKATWVGGREIAISLDVSHYRIHAEAVCPHVLCAGLIMVLLSTCMDVQLHGFSIKRIIKLKAD